MITYNFTNTGSDPLYEYLYKCIKNDILQANIRPGEKLPSKRSFAKNLGISVITVENAYEQLIAEGYIYSIPKRGFYVTDFRTSMEIEKKKFTREMLPLTEGTSGYLADFASNQTQSELFPFTIWTKIVREVLNSNQMQQSSLRWDPATQGSHRHLSERIPRYDCPAGADRHRCRNGISLRTSDPAFR